MSNTASSVTHDPDCIFCKIVDGKIPSKKIYEDNETLVFHDIHPAAPVHFLLIPKVHVASLADVDDSHQALLGRLLALAPRLAKEQGLTGGFRTVVNTGRDGGQVVFHLHLHVLGGPKPWRSEF
jgi:histidine triad (HIT) family protein